MPAFLHAQGPCSPGIEVPESRTITAPAGGVLAAGRTTLRAPCR